MSLFFYYLALLAIIAYFMLPRIQKARKAMRGELIVAPAGADRERLTKSGLHAEPDPDIKILDISRLRLPADLPQAGPIDYRANRKREWVIEIVPENPADFFEKKELWAMFDRDFRVKYDAFDLYGLAVDPKRWTYVIAGNSPEQYSRLEAGVSLLTLSEEETAGQNLLNDYRDAIQAKFEKFRFKIRFHPETSEQEGFQRMTDLHVKREKYHKEFGIVLQGERPYAGRAAWDCLCRLGLTWGDMDLFHWENPTRQGPDAFFSVATNTPPGYFLPERIVDGSFQPTDLQFSFVPLYSPDSEQVLDAMYEAAAFCQASLGGKLMNPQGRPYELKEAQLALADLLAGMQADGIEPGEGL